MKTEGLSRTHSVFLRLQFRAYQGFLDSFRRGLPRNPHPLRRKEVAKYSLDMRGCLLPGAKGAGKGKRISADGRRPYRGCVRMVRGYPEEAPPGGPGGSGFVTTKVAAEALGVNPRTTRAYIERGELKAKTEGERIQKTYLVSIDSRYVLRDQRGYPRPSRKQTREEAAGADVPAGDLTGIIRDLTSELVQRSQESAELRTRLELTAQAESSLREQLMRERERTDKLEGAQEEANRLRAELEAERSKGFWRRLFGG